MSAPLTVRWASGPDDLARLRALRARAYGLAEDGDRWDAGARHLVAERGAEPVATLRLLQHSNGRSAARDGYSAQFYDMAAFAHLGGPMIEVGRLSLPPAAEGAAAARALFAALVADVRSEGARWLFGCTSLAGADPLRHRASLAALAAHVGPPALRPVPRAGLPAVALPPPEAGPVPPLFAFYLALGGWLSAHAVLDPALDTLHLFTAVEVARIPAARARLLDRLAAMQTRRP